MKKLISAIVLSGALAFSANAMPVTFEYSGFCTNACGKIGLGRGDVIGGYITAGSGALDDGRLFGFELIDFAFSFGTLSFDSSTRDAFGQMRLGPFGQALVGLGGGRGGFTFSNRRGRRDVSTDVLFGPINVWTVDTRGRRDPAGFGAYTRVAGSPVEVPEPGTLGLLGLGLIGTVVARRRAKRA